MDERDYKALNSKEYKEDQKQLITEIMNEDAKDGLYDTKKQTAIQWLMNQFGYIDTPRKLIFDKAKEMDKKQTEEMHNIISEIDFELAMIEDYAHGEVGDAITNLRHKIQQYYGKTHDRS